MGGEASATTITSPCNQPLPHEWSTTAAIARTPPSRSYKLLPVSGAAWSGDVSAIVNRDIIAMKNFSSKLLGMNLYVSGATCEHGSVLGKGRSVRQRA